MSEQFTIEQFQTAISEAVIAGLNRKEVEDAGAFVTSGGEVKHFVDFLNAVKGNDRDALKDLEVGTGSAGGYTVPISFQGRILEVAAENAIVYPRAQKISLSEGVEVDIPSLDQTSSPDDNETAFFGGVRAYWTEEGAAKEQSEPAFKQVAMRLHDLAFFAYVSDRLLSQSGVGIDRYLTNLFGRALAWYADLAMIQGDGVGKPWGVIHSPATIQVPRTGAGAIVYEDIMAMVHAFLPGSGVWVVSPCCMEELLKLEDDEGHYMWIPNARDGMARTLMGYPIIFSEKASELGSKGDIGLYDFRYYICAEASEGMRVQSSPDYRFIYDQTTFRAHWLVDGKPQLSEPITLRGGTYEVSPFVTLDTYGA